VTEHSAPVATITKPAGPTILIVATRSEEIDRAAAILEKAGFLVASADNAASALEWIYAQPPQCLLIEHEGPLIMRNPLLAELKSDNVYGHLPAVLMLSREDLGKGVDWIENPADDYLIRPFTDGELTTRINLCIARAHRDVNANPLSGLPGNIPIMREAERRIAAGQPFAMGYLDIDNFKPFNDKYGFSRGDEVLRMTTRLLVNAIRMIDSNETYVGHIGGDDFVFMTPPALVTKTCKQIVADFDAIVPSFYDEEDRRSGFIQSVDRKGAVQTFPLMTVSIGVVDTSSVRVTHVADLSARAAEVKHFTKQLSGSNFIIDRRKT
jgi:diguanylate cyclase (GGDEF)-like protein